MKWWTFWYFLFLGYGECESESESKKEGEWVIESRVVMEKEDTMREINDTIFYNIVLQSRDNSDHSKRYFQEYLLNFSISSCSILQIYFNLIKYNYLCFTIACQSGIILTHEIFENIKYFEQSIEYEVANTNKLHLHQQQQRSEIPDISHCSYCTLTYDAYRAFTESSSHYKLVSRDIVSIFLLLCTHI